MIIQIHATSETESDAQNKKYVFFAKQNSVMNHIKGEIYFLSALTKYFRKNAHIIINFIKEIKTSISLRRGLFPRYDSDNETWSRRNGRYF